MLNSSITRHAPNESGQISCVTGAAWYKTINFQVIINYSHGC